MRAPARRRYSSRPRKPRTSTCRTAREEASERSAESRRRGQLRLPGTSVPRAPPRSSYPPRPGRGAMSSEQGDQALRAVGQERFMSRGRGAAPLLRQRFRAMPRTAVKPIPGPPESARIITFAMRAAQGSQPSQHARNRASRRNDRYQFVCETSCTTQAAGGPGSEMQAKPAQPVADAPLAPEMPSSSRDATTRIWAMSDRRLVSQEQDQAATDINRHRSRCSL